LYIKNSLLFISLVVDVATKASRNYDLFYGFSIEKEEEGVSR